MPILNTDPEQFFGLAPYRLLLCCLKLMVAGVINNATNDVQIYTECIDNKDDIMLPYLSEMKYDTITVGQGSSADALLTQCTPASRYLLICVWATDTTVGKPNSWIVYDMNTLKVANSSPDNYTASLGGSFNAGYIITIRKGPGGGGWWIYILAVIILMIVIGLGVFFGFKILAKKKPIHIL